MLTATEAIVMGAESIGEISGTSIQLCYEPKAALKKKKKYFFKMHNLC